MEEGQAFLEQALGQLIGLGVARQAQAAQRQGRTPGVTLLSEEHEALRGEGCRLPIIGLVQGDESEVTQGPGQAGVVDQRREQDSTLVKPHRGPREIALHARQNAGSA